MTEISIKAEELFHIGHFAVTNALLLSSVTVILLLVLGFIVRKNLKMIPGKFQSIIELLFEEILNFMESVLGSKALAIRYLPLIATIFIFVMISNWLGLMPGVGSIGMNEYKEGHEIFVPLFRAPAADLNFTIALAMISMISVNLLAVLALGIKKHLSKFFTLKNPLFTFVGLLEFISEFVKIISFSFRLFGNVFAGEVLLTIIVSLVPYAVPLPFLFLEIFVGFIQAFIFAMLTLVFIAMATSHEEAH
jgi:F-type H+-transporting ATPase subunit a